MKTYLELITNANIERYSILKKIISEQKTDYFFGMKNNN